MTSDLSLPKPKALQRSVILALGLATDFRSGVLVSHQNLVNPTLEAFGLDPQDLKPENGWTPKSMLSLVYEALCKVYHRKELLQRRGADLWSLTPAGVAEALALKPKDETPVVVLETCFSEPTFEAVEPEPNPLVESEFDTEFAKLDFAPEMPLETVSETQQKNLTADFLERRLKATGGLNGQLWNLFRVTLKAHLTISDTTDRIEDHIQTGLTRLIHRDALRERLLSGQPVEDTQLSSYILRSAYNDCRDAGTEPTSREMYGALTEKERATGVKRGPILDSRVSWQKNSDRHDTSTIAHIRDTESHGTREAIQDSIYFDECWREVEKIFQARRPQVWQQYVGILKMCAEGSKTRIKDIAEAEGITPVKAAALLTEARKVLKAARKTNLRKFIAG